MIRMGIIRLWNPARSEWFERSSFHFGEMPVTLQVSIGYAPWLFWMPRRARKQLRDVAQGHGFRVVSLELMKADDSELLRVMDIPESAKFVVAEVSRTNELNRQKQDLAASCCRIILYLDLLSLSLDSLHGCSAYSESKDYDDVD